MHSSNIENFTNKTINMNIHRYDQINADYWILRSKKRQLQINYRQSVLLLLVFRSLFSLLWRAINLSLPTVPQTEQDETKTD